MKKELIVVLDNIRSRENVGSIFRTADGAGVSKIYLCGITPTPRIRDTGSDSYHDRDINQILKHDGFYDKIAKTALGAEKWIPWEYQSQTWRCLLKLKSKNDPFDKTQGHPERSRTGKKLKIIALEQTKDSIDLFKYKLPKNKKIALVMGNEVRGLSPQILKYCDKKIAIPMYGKKESLNVSVATGIALYQLLHS